MQTQQTEGTTRAPNGRKGRDGTDEVIKFKPIKDATKDLMTLYKKKQQADADYRASLKAVAERGNVNSGNLNRLVKASAKGNYADVRRDIDQQSVLFESIGEIQSGPATSGE